MTPHNNIPKGHLVLQTTFTFFELVEEDPQPGWRVGWKASSFVLQRPVSKSW
jgi:hypothetical protein